LLELFATKASRKDYVESVVGLLRSWCGCRCAGIRLVDDQGHIPYTDLSKSAFLVRRRSQLEAPFFAQVKPQLSTDPSGMMGWVALI